MKTIISFMFMLLMFISGCGTNELTGNSGLQLKNTDKLDIIHIRNEENSSHTLTNKGEFNKLNGWLNRLNLSVVNDAQQQEKIKHLLHTDVDAYEFIVQLNTAEVKNIGSLCTYIDINDGSYLRLITHAYIDEQTDFEHAEGPNMIYHINGDIINKGVCTSADTEYIYYKVDSEDKIALDFKADSLGADRIKIEELRDIVQNKDTRKLDKYRYIPYQGSIHYLRTYIIDDIWLASVLTTNKDIDLSSEDTQLMLVHNYGESDEESIEIQNVEDIDKFVEKYSLP